MLRTSDQNIVTPVDVGDRHWGKDFLWKILICAGVTTVLSYALYIVGTKHFSVDPALSDQGWASYIGIIFATAVALAGSLVAIALATRAQESGNAQLELSKLANEIAERQSTESTLAVEGTAQYQQFKSMLITIPAMLRRAHRDRLFEQDGNIGMLAHMVEIIGVAITTWLASNVPATVVELAGIIEKQKVPALPREKRLTVESQLYFEFAISSLQYDLAALRVALSEPPEQRLHVSLRMQLMRLLHGTYALVHELDDLLEFANIILHEKPQEFTILQRKFIEHAWPIAQLNRNLQLTNDFDNFAEEIWLRQANSLTPMGRLGESAFSGEHHGGVLLALHDSGHAEALTAIQRVLRTKEDPQSAQVVRLDNGAWIKQAAALESGIVPIFLVTEALTDRLLQLHAFLAQEAAAKWPRRILVIDQVEQPAGAAVSAKHLSFSETITCWHYFAAVATVLDIGEREALHDSDPVIRNIILAARPGVDRHREAGDWDSLVRGKRQALLKMIEGAAATESEPVPDLEEHASAVVDLCERTIDIVLGRLAHGDDHGAGFPSFDADDPGYASLAATVRQLGELPLLDRPLFNFPRSSGYIHFSGDNIDLALPGTTVFGVAYLDAHFAVPASPLLTLLAERPAYQLF